MSLWRTSGPAGHGSAGNTRRSERFDRPRQIDGAHEKIDVLREALIAVLDHRETTGDRERNTGVTQDAGYPYQCLVDGPDGDLTHPGCLEKLAVGAKCCGAHRVASRVLLTREPTRVERMVEPS